MIFVDAHVHIHDCFPLQAFMDAAYNNIKAAAQNVGMESFAGVLLLTETSRACWYKHLYELSADNNQPLNSWQFHRTNESQSLFAQKDNTKYLFIIAGRQIVTAENLEVLALGTDSEFADGEPIQDVIDDVRNHGALAVVPWGFGKWFGKRGVIVHKVLDEISGSDFYLGDNSGRTLLMPTPSHFNLAKTKGISVLPGTDPLPFEQEYSRPGCFGFNIPGELKKTTPFADLKKIIRENQQSIKPYGKFESPLRFIKNQIAMQFVKRKQPVEV